jgi:uridine kinase
MAYLIILRGPMGAGKTSVARQLKERFGGGDNNSLSHDDGKD